MLGPHLPIHPMKGQPKWAPRDKKRKTEPEPEPEQVEPEPVEPEPMKVKSEPERSRVVEPNPLAVIGFSLAVIALMFLPFIKEAPDIAYRTMTDVAIPLLTIASALLGGVFSLVGFVKGCRRNTRGFGFGLLGLIITFIYWTI